MLYTNFALPHKFVFLVSVKAEHGSVWWWGEHQWGSKDLTVRAHMKTRGLNPSNMDPVQILLGFSYHFTTPVTQSSEKSFQLPLTWIGAVSRSRISKTYCDMSAKRPKSRKRRRPLLGNGSVTRQRMHERNNRRTVGGCVLHTVRAVDISGEPKPTTSENEAK
jgi:hypothetical protein